MNWRGRMKAGGVGPVRVVFWLLAILLVIQSVRLVWAIVTPVSPVGKWHSAKPIAAITGAPGFDPFFRLAGGGAGQQAVVTSLALKLFGTRIDFASGRGSAIIATPDGVQSSYAVGEEIVPGVKLKEVAADHVLIDRGGATEQLFLDQSVAAPVAAPVGPPGAPPPSLPVVSAQSVQDLVTMAPRMNGPSVTGITLTPKGDGTAFRAAGLEPGDVLISVDGRPVQSIGDFGALPVGGNGPVLQIERGGRPITLNAKAPK